MEQVFMRKKEVLAIIGMKTTWLVEAVKEGSFPRPVRLGARAVGWRTTDVKKWIDSRKEA
jgi:prophage regulatory protein